jgi:hypothetical protein
VSRQPIPGEVWTRTRTGRQYECLATFTGEFHRWAVWGAHVDLSPEVFHVTDMTPPPELPPAELVAHVRTHWFNVYDDSGAPIAYPSREIANDRSSPDRAWLVHPDGRWQKCNGKEVIGDPVEVPR